jgi:hypothetical protein
MIAFISNNITYLSLGFSFVSILIAYFAYIESKRMRRAQQQPILLVKSVLNRITILNTGNGPAFNIEVQIKIFQNNILTNSGSGPFTYSFILPGEQVSQEASFPMGDFEVREITVKYESVHKDKSTLVYVEDVDLKGERKRGVILKKSKV